MADIANTPHSAPADHAPSTPVQRSDSPIQEGLGGISSGQDDSHARASTSYNEGSDKPEGGMSLIRDPMYFTDPLLAAEPSRSSQPIWSDRPTPHPTTRTSTSGASSPTISSSLMISTPALATPIPVATSDHAQSRITHVAQTDVASGANHRRRRRPQSQGQTSAATRRNSRSFWSLIRSIRAFFGHGNPARSRIMHFIFRLSFGLAQVAVTIVFIALTKTVWRSPRAVDQGRSEWDTCNKPLGALLGVWLARAILGVLLTVWGFRRFQPRPRTPTRTEAQQRRGLESGVAPDATGTQSLNLTSSPTYGLAPQPAIPSMYGTSTPTATPVTSSWDPFYDRLTTVVSMLVVAHFCAGNILLYSSVNTCRHSSPHLWWITFAILSITYIIVLEVLAICLTVFIIMPLLFVGINVILICLGRRPISARQIIDPSRINPETPKIPQRLVDKIPLVLYIPVPEDPATAATHTYPPNDSTGAEIPVVQDGPTEPTAIQSPPAVHTDSSAKPVSPLPAKSKRPRFGFFQRRKRNSSTPNASSSKNGDDEPKDTWEDNWEKSSLPFVRLENNRAACAICLMDFDEPPRRDRDRTEAAPEEPEPLRLLDCGHVFHKSCLDPWLSGVSGRCPTCQKSVEIPEDKARRR